jgi:hypothetical protein
MREIDNKRSVLEMKERKFVLSLILIGALVLFLISIGSLLAEIRVAYVNFERPEVNRVIVDAHRKVDQSVREFLPDRLTLEPPIDVQRLPALNGLSFESGQTIILRDHRLASIGDFLRSGLSFVFKMAGVILIAIGALSIFRQRYQIVEKVPVEKL